MPDIFKSRKFQAAIVALIVSLLVAYVPQLEPYREQLDIIIAPFVVYIISHALTDVVAIRARGKNDATS